MYFGFRITVCADGTEVIDRRQGTFCCWLTPLQMAEYLEMDKQLAVMDRMERKVGAEHRRKTRYRHISDMQMGQQKKSGK